MADPSELGHVLPKVQALVNDSDFQGRIKNNDKHMAEVKAVGLATALKENLGKRYIHASLDQYRIYHRNQEQVVEMCRDIADSIDKFVADGRNIILYGSVGTGKDHLVAALLLIAARAGFQCKWLNGIQLYGSLRDRMNESRSEQAMIRDLLAPSVLAISDPLPPVGELSAWRIEFMYRLINERYVSMKSTWLTINATSPVDAEEKLSTPVWDRLQEMGEIVPCFWPSFRERK